MGMIARPSIVRMDERSLKPRIRKWPYVPMWSCRLDDVTGNGPTPAAAYRSWYSLRMMIGPFRRLAQRGGCCGRGWRA
jgi:hypothetical protein